MKKVLLIAPLAFMAACSQPAVEGDLQTLTAQRDSIKTVVDGLNARSQIWTRPSRHWTQRLRTMLLPHLR